jgi:hypothetical protein
LLRRSGAGAGGARGFGAPPSTAVAWPCTWGARPDATWGALMGARTSNAIRTRIHTRIAEALACGLVRAVGGHRSAALRADLVLLKAFEFAAEYMRRAARPRASPRPPHSGARLQVCECAPVCALTHAAAQSALRRRIRSHAPGPAMPLLSTRAGGIASGAVGLHDPSSTGRRACAYLRCRVTPCFFINCVAENARLWTDSDLRWDQAAG